MRLKKRRKWSTYTCVLILVSAAGVFGLCGLSFALGVGFGRSSISSDQRELGSVPSESKNAGLNLQNSPRGILASNPVASAQNAASSSNKASPMSSNTSQMTKRQQSPNGGAFVHMGKTGGSTLSILLRNGCHSYVAHPCREIAAEHESLASRRIESYYHVPDFGLLPVSHHDFYLITMRDPFDRTVSAFVFEHIRNKDARNEEIDEFKRPKYEEAYRCFPTLQSFVELLGEDSKQFKYPYHKALVVADSCTDLARAAFHGRVKIYNHLYFGYQRIGTLIPDISHQTLYATRQEHLWDDWKTVNDALGQTDVYIPPNQQVRNMTVLELQNQLPVTRHLTALGRDILCRALKEEYEAYFWILQRAKNLSPHDISQSMAYAKKNCPDVSLR